MPAEPKKFLTLSERSTCHSLEDVVGCKWSAGVVAALSQGGHRPGALERYIPGISTKMLNERLRKLPAYGLIIREESAGLPAHVEYHITTSGVRLAESLGQLRVLNGEHQATLADKEGAP